MDDQNIKRKIVRIGGKLKEVTTILDSQKNIIHKVISPIMFEVYPRDIMQIIVGSTILAIPIAFTEETWKLGASLPLLNVLILAILSLIFIATFVYYNFYRSNVGEYKLSFTKRVLSIYLISFVMVAAILTIIQVADWQVDFLLALKRTIIVTFPASMSAAISDMIK